MYSTNVEFCLLIKWIDTAKTLASKIYHIGMATCLVTFATFSLPIDHILMVDQELIPSVFNAQSS